MNKIIILADGRIVKADKIREVYTVNDVRNTNSFIKVEYDDGTNTTVCICPGEDVGFIMGKIAKFLVNDQVMLNFSGEVDNEQV